MSSSTGPTVLNSPGSYTAEQIRELLHKHLRQSARFIKTVELMVQVCLWLSGLLALWLAAAVIDHWLIPLPSLGRWLFWIAGVGGSIAWSAWYMLPLLVHKINPVYAARQIEQSIPDFKDGLVSWLELEQLPDNGVPRGIMAGLARHAARFLHDQDPSSTVDSSGLIRVAGMLLFLFASLVVYTMASPKSVAATGQRILMPWRALQAPTRVQILDVKPGQCELTQGLPLRLEVTLRGLRRGERVSVRFSTLDGQLRDQTRFLEPVTEGYSYAGLLATNSSGVENELDYWIEAGDARSGPFRVAISPLPAIEVEQVKLVFPDYTQLPDRTVSGGQVEAVEGTSATILARANQRIVRARLEIDPQVDAAGELERAAALLDMQVDDRQVSATLSLRINAAGDNPTEVKYRVRGFNARSLANQRPIIQSLRVLADLPPEASLVGPDSRVLKVTNKSRLQLEIRASDPDFGLNQIALDIARGGAPLRREVLLEVDGVLGQQVATYRLNMADLEAKAGDRFELVASARDNRHAPDSGAWSPNVTSSAPLTVEVVEPEQFAKEPPQSMVEQPKTATPTQPDSQLNNASTAKNASSAKGAGQASDRQSPSKQSADSANSSPSQQPSKSEQKSGQAEGSSSDKKQSGTGASGDESKSPSRSSGGNSRDQSSTGAGQKNPASRSSSSGGGSSSGQRGSGANSASGDGQTTSDSQKSESSTSQSTSPSNGTGQSRSEDRAGSPNGKPASDGEVIDRVQEYVRERQDSPRSPSGAADAGQGADPASGASQSEDPRQPPGAGQQTQGQSQAGDGTKTESKTGSGGGESAKKGASATQSAKNNSENSRSKDSQPSTSQTASGQSKSGQSSTGQADPGSSKGNQSKGSQSSGGQPGEAPSASGQSGAGKSASDGQSGSSDSGAGQSASGQSKSGQASAGQANPGSSNGNQSNGSQSSGGQSGDAPSASGQSGAGKSASQGQSGSSDSGAGQSANGQSKSGQASAGQADPGSSKGNQSKESQSSGGQSGDAPSASGQSGAGKSASNGQSGSSDAGAGQTATGQSRAGQSGEAPSAGGESGTGTSNGQPSGGQGGKAGGGQSSGGKAGSGNSGGGKAGGSSGSRQASGDSPAASGANGSGNPGGGPGEDQAANEEYAKKATDMVLDYLDHQRDQPDPELLKRLDWTPQDLNDFVQRWQKARQFADSPDPNQKREWEDKLRSLGLQPPATKPRQAASSDDKLRGMQESGARVRPPESLRKQYEAFRKSLQEQNGAK